jgi:hypothetical protein
MAIKRSDIAEVVSAVAVVIGLVFVGVELRQNTEIQRITATQTLAQQYASALEVMAYEGEAACAYALGISGLENLDEQQRLRFFVIMFQIMRAGEQLHYYAAEGRVEPRIWRGFERQLREIAALPGVQGWWEARRSWFSDEFQVFLDELIADGPATAPQTYIDHACLTA